MFAHLTKVATLQKLGTGANNTADLVEVKLPNGKIKKVVELQCILSDDAESTMLEAAIEGQDMMDYIFKKNLPGIIPCIHIDESKVIENNRSTQKNRIYYLEYASRGTLNDYPLPYKKSIKQFQYLCHAVANMHKIGVAHCDINLNNVVLTDSGKACLIDFENSRSIENYDDPIFATNGYASPELNKRYFDRKAFDAWSLGIALYQMLMRDYPPRDPLTLEFLGFDHPDTHQGFFAKDEKGHWINPYAASIASIIVGLLQSDPQKRYEFFLEMQKKDFIPEGIESLFVKKKKIMHEKKSETFTLEQNITSLNKHSTDSHLHLSNMQVETLNTYDPLIKKAKKTFLEYFNKTAVNEKKFFYYTMHLKKIKSKEKIMIWNNEQKQRTLFQKHEAFALSWSKSWLNKINFEEKDIQNFKNNFNIKNLTFTEHDVEVIKFYENVSLNPWRATELYHSLKENNNQFIARFYEAIEVYKLCKKYKNNFDKNHLELVQKGLDTFFDMFFNKLNYKDDKLLPYLKTVYSSSVSLNSSGKISFDNSIANAGYQEIALENLQKIQKKPGCLKLTSNRIDLMEINTTHSILMQKSFALHNKIEFDNIPRIIQNASLYLSAVKYENIEILNLIKNSYISSIKFIMALIELPIDEKISRLPIIFDYLETFSLNEQMKNMVQNLKIECDKYFANQHSAEQFEKIYPIIDKILENIYDPKHYKNELMADMLKEIKRTRSISNTIEKNENAIYTYLAQLEKDLTLGYYLSADLKLQKILTLSSTLPPNLGNFYKDLAYSKIYASKYYLEYMEIFDLEKNKIINRTPENREKILKLCQDKLELLNQNIENFIQNKLVQTPLDRKILASLNKHAGMEEASLFEDQQLKEIYQKVESRKNMEKLNSEKNPSWKTHIASNLNKIISIFSNNPTALQPSHLNLVSGQGHIQLFINKEIIDSFNQVIRSFQLYFNSHRYLRNIEILDNNILVQLKHNGITELDKLTIYPQVLQYLLAHVHLDKPEKMLKTLENLTNTNKSSMPDNLYNMHKMMYNAILQKVSGSKMETTLNLA